ncbi:hypothetical protein D9M69_529240 [compost metagenome]
MRRASPEHHRLRQVLRSLQTPLNIGVVAVQLGHVLVHRFGLVELALALEVQRQVLEVVHQCVAEWHAAHAVKGHVQLPLPLQRQAHHAVGLRRLLV